MDNTYIKIRKLILSTTQWNFMYLCIHPDRNIEYFLIPLVDFPSAICTSQVNCLIYLYFHYMNGIIFGTVIGEVNISSKVKMLNIVPHNCFELYLLISLSLSAFTLKQVIRSWPLGASQKIRFIQWNSRASPSAIRLSNLPYVEIMSALASSSCMGTTILTMYSRPLSKCCCQCPTVTC